MFQIMEVVRAGLSATSKLLEYQVKGFEAEGDSGNSGLTDKVQHLEQIGVAANPVPARSLRALTVQIGKELVALKVWDKSKRPTGLAPGEIRFHGLEKVAAALRILLDGTLYIDSDFANGKDIVLNGGSAKVARVDDAVNGGAATAIANLSTGTVTFIYTPVGGVPGAPSTTLTLSGGKITSGAPHILA